ncbi:MAG: response regulator [Lachnospiraceae bacterium]|nr:response regulator [Lachnospiraceae bacterium]
MNSYSGRQPNMANELENNILNVHLVMVLVTSLGGIGLVIEGILLDWEFWVLPLIIVGIIAIWSVYITQPLTINIREGIYVAFILFLAIFHGVHYTSFFDVSLMSVLIMITLTGTGRKAYQDYVIIEYIVVVFAQFYLTMKNGGIAGDVLTISKIILHILTVIIAYNICRNYVVQSRKNQKIVESYISEVKRTNEAMEDFLANISHEFRTPVNVVTGLSSILMKENKNDNIIAINEAGLRLANQIDDILDYNEIIGNRLNISEEEYMISLLVNDVVKTARPFVEQKHLDFVMDLDPAVPAVLNGDASRIRKMLLHLISNAVKFTEKGGLYVKISSAERSYGVNLDIEVTDTGKGMSREDIGQLSEILYQADKGRDRSTGGIGLGLTIVYGFAHAMGGFARIESEQRRGTTVHVSIPQSVTDNSPCLSLSHESSRCVVTYIRPEKYKIPEIRDFYFSMIENLSRGLKVSVHNAGSHRNLKDICEHMPVTNIFTGQDEYIADRDYLIKLSQKICVVVNVFHDFAGVRDENILYIPNPIYGVPIVNIVNAGSDYKSLQVENTYEKPLFTGVRALVVDDENMNLIVASGLFQEYGMITDTAESGREAIAKYNDNEYDVVFMDHMMPEMDGVVAMKKLKETGRKKGREAVVIALTANAVSGAREMLLSEGFDGFIAKPIDTGEFERVMRRVLPPALVRFKGGGRS